MSGNRAASDPLNLGRLAKSIQDWPKEADPAAMAYRPAANATAQHPQRQAVQQPQPQPQPPQAVARQHVSRQPAQQPSPQSVQTLNAQPAANQAPRVRVGGNVVECDGLQATILSAAQTGQNQTDAYWAVGQLISIAVGTRRVVSVITEVATQAQSWSMDGGNAVKLTVELVGEVVEQTNGGARFTSGITIYPHVGAVAHRIRRADLQSMFHSNGQKTIEVGTLSQDSQLSAYVSVSDLVSRHFAVLGMTGTGKSTAVAMILRKVMEVDPDLAILVLDPHNEFESAFGAYAETITPQNLDLPFWVFNFEEFSHIVFRGRQPDPVEYDLLRQLIPQARAMFREAGVDAKLRKQSSGETASVDSPTPYRISDIQWLLNERIGSLNNSDARPPMRALGSRLLELAQDRRYSFMFRQNPIHDNFLQVISQIYRIPKNGKPVTSFQLSGLPSETVNAVVAVVCRLAFDLAVISQGSLRSLILCEEAHRYIPFDQKSVFAPTREAIARIAKEGRKYGCSIGIVSQRPRDLDPTILSQCNTFFVLRLGNEEDQTVVHRAISSASQSMIKFLSSLGDREAIAFGQAIGSPMRIKFSEVSSEHLPKNHLIGEFTPQGHGKPPLGLDQMVSALRKY